MQYGLFGKLPSKRDFVAHAVPRAFLQLWEPWLEKGLSEIRMNLGEDIWTETFCSAPIWRFWLGADVCGSVLLGAIMPSVDAIGRYFPLTLVGMPEDELLMPPHIDPHHAWFQKIEDILLSALEADMRFDTLLAEIDKLKSLKDFDAACAADSDLQLDSQDPILFLPAEMFEIYRKAAEDCSVETATFWWTAGGTHFDPVCLMLKHLPEANILTGMFTGNFDSCDLIEANESKPQ